MRGRNPIDTWREKGKENDSRLLVPMVVTDIHSSRSEIDIVMKLDGGN
jgi:hypothetical protein